MAVAIAQTITPQTARTELREFLDAVIRAEMEGMHTWLSSIQSQAVVALALDADDDAIGMPP